MAVALTRRLRPGQLPPVGWKRVPGTDLAQPYARPVPPPAPGERGETGRPPTDEELARAVEAFMLAHPIPSAAPGRDPTVEQITAAVEAFMLAHPLPPPSPGTPGTPGQPGRDGVGIEFMSVVDGCLVLVLTDGRALRWKIKGERGERGYGAVGSPGRDGDRGPIGPVGSFAVVVTAVNYSLVGKPSTLLLVDATAGNVVVTLPLASAAAAVEHVVQRTDGSANLVTITGDSVNGDGDAIVTQRNTALHLYPTPTLGYRIG